MVGVDAKIRALAPGVPLPAADGEVLAAIRAEGSRRRHRRAAGAFVLVLSVSAGALGAATVGTKASTPDDRLRVANASAAPAPGQPQEQVGPFRLGYLPSGFVVSRNGPDNQQPDPIGSGQAYRLEATGRYDAAAAARRIPAASLTVQITPSTSATADELLGTLKTRSGARAVAVNGRSGVIFSPDLRTRSLVFRTDGFLVQISGTSLTDVELQRVAVEAVHER